MERQYIIKLKDRIGINEKKIFLEENILNDKMKKSKNYISVNMSRTMYKKLVLDDRVEVIEDDKFHKFIEIVEYIETSDKSNYALDLCQKREQMDRIHIYDGDNVGKNVDIVIIDTGVDKTHTEFLNSDGTSRVKKLPNSQELEDNLYGDSFLDLGDHGTHVAGTCSGNTFGWARGASIYACKALSNEGSGTFSGIIDWINLTKDFHVAKNNDGIQRPTIINMSLGGPGTISINSAITEAYNEGIIIVSAAGNENTYLSFHDPPIASDYLTTSPGSSRYNICVGSSTEQFTISGFSNYGPRIDVFAPGSNIISSVSSLPSGRNINSTSIFNGTSMATPQIVGIISRAMSDSLPMTKEQVENSLNDGFWNNLMSPCISLNYNIHYSNDSKNLCMCEIGNNTNKLSSDKFRHVVTNFGTYTVSNVNFLWREISTIATLHEMEDDSIKNIQLPSEFTYYNNNYTSINIFSNGNISFDSNANISYANQLLPDSSKFNSILVFWDDFNPTIKPVENTGIYTYYDSATKEFIITWNNLVLYDDDTNTLNTFQCILKIDTGEIILQYKTFSQIISATIGIQSIGGSNYKMIHNNGNNYEGFQLNHQSAVKFNPIVNSNEKIQFVPYNCLGFDKVFSKNTIDYKLYDSISGLGLEKSINFK